MDHVRIRAAGGIVLGDRGTLAMIRHKNGTGTWFFPKGRIEEGEDDETAARREIAEETGIANLEYLDDLGVYERYHMTPEGETERSEIKEIHMYLFAAPPHAELRPAYEIADARWVPLPQVVDECGSVRDRAWFTTVFERIRQAVQRD